MDPTPTSEPSSGVRPATQPTWNESLSQLDNYAEQIRVKLPLAPPGLLDGYMSFAPWVAIVGGVLVALVSLVGLVASTLIAPLMILIGAGGSGVSGVLNSLLLLVISLLSIAGGWLMLQRHLNGWWLLAAGMLVSILTSLLHVSILGLIFWLLIAYVHLQVKPNYN